MTDARLPSRWLNSPTHDQLSDRAWRVHTYALMWSNEQGTDGLIPTRTLRLLHPDGATTDDASELVRLGLWERRGDDFAVADWVRSGQELAAKVEWQRERNRRKNQALRDREREQRVTGHEPGHEPGHVTGHVGGQDRTGPSTRELTTRDIVQRSASNTSADDDAAARAPEARPVDHVSARSSAPASQASHDLARLTQLHEAVHGRAPSRQRITSWRSMSPARVAQEVRYLERQLEALS